MFGRTHGKRTHSLSPRMRELCRRANTHTYGMLNIVNMVRRSDRRTIVDTMKAGQVASKVSKLDPSAIAPQLTHHDDFCDIYKARCARAVGLQLRYI